jgi:predicted enzyme related to lactoylglutathione lyase
MTHRSALRKIVIDVAGSDADHARELAFWEAATGQTLTRLERHPEYHGAELPGRGIGLLVQRLGRGPNRVHVDIHTDDVEAEVERLAGLGAQRVESLARWSVMRDPAGLLFCVVVDHTLDDSNSHVWPSLGSPATQTDDRSSEGTSSFASDA